MGGSSIKGGARSYNYGEFNDAVNKAFEPINMPTYAGKNLEPSGVSSVDSYAKRTYGTKAKYAEELDKYRMEHLTEGYSQTKIDKGLYFNDVTAGMTKDQKVDAYLNGYLAEETFNFDDGSTYTRRLGDKTALQGRGSKYQLQEELGETVEGYTKRRDESRRRDALRKQMLAEKDIMDGGKSKQQTNKGDLG